MYRRTEDCYLDFYAQLNKPPLKQFYDVFQSMQYIQWSQNQVIYILVIIIIEILKYLNKT